MKVDFITTVEMRSDDIPAFEYLTFANSKCFWIAPVLGLRIGDDPAVSGESSDPMNGGPVSNRALWASSFGYI